MKRPRLTTKIARGLQQLVAAAPAAASAGEAAHAASWVMSIASWFATRVPRSRRNPRTALARARRRKLLKQFRRR